MRTTSSLALVLLLVLAACGSRQPAPSPGPGDGTPAPAGTMSEAECTAAGGVARWDIGDGNVQCEPDEEELARIPVGIEGGICCRPVDEAD